MSTEFTKQILGDKVPESPEKQIHREVTPTKDELFASKGKDTPEILTPYEENQLNAPPQKGYTGNVITTNFNFLGGKDDMKTKEILDDAEAILPSLIKVAAVIGKWTKTTGQQKMDSVLAIILGGLGSYQTVVKGGAKTSADVLVPALEAMAQEAYDDVKASGILDNLEKMSGTQAT